MRSRTASSETARRLFQAEVERMVPIVLQPRLCFQDYGPCHHLALAGSHSTSRVSLNCVATIWHSLCEKRGTQNETNDRGCCSRAGADVVGEGRRARRRRRVGSCIGCRSTWADWSRGWCSGGIYGWTLDIEFMGPPPLEHPSPGAQSRESGGSCRKRPTRGQHSTSAPSVCAQR